MVITTNLRYVNPIGAFATIIFFGTLYFFVSLLLRKKKVGKKFRHWLYNLISNMPYWVALIVMCIPQQITLWATKDKNDAPFIKRLFISAASITVGLTYNMGGSFHNDLVRILSTAAFAYRAIKLRNMETINALIASDSLSTLFIRAFSQCANY